jgi:oligopeptide transport system substrate-binding protein
MKSIVVILLMGVLSLAGCTKKTEFKEKVLNLVTNSKVKGFDPIFSNDVYSSKEVAKIYEGLLEYHYLKRPYELQPNLAESMPEVSKDGLTFTFKLKKGVKFHKNNCFPEGKSREMVASDVVYSIMRLADPKLQSTGWWLLDGKIVGLNEWRDKNANADVVDYNQVIEGIKAIDSHTVQFKLIKQFPQFLYSLAMSFTFIVPKEAVEYYGNEFLNNPVGTGPFVTETYTQSNQIVYTKNPEYREKYYPDNGELSDANNGLLDDAGKRVPLVDKLIVNIIVEEQPRWLAFEKGKLDYAEVPKDNFSNVISNEGKLLTEFIEKGVKLNLTPDLDITYSAFNHELEIFKNKKVRQAMALSIDTKELNKLFYNGIAKSAQSILPPGMEGYDQNFENPYLKYDLKKAKQLLAEAGYPDGKGIPKIIYECPAQTTNKQLAEFFQKSVEKIGIKVEVSPNPWPELQKKINTKQAMMWGIAWVGDYPDGENFLQLLYGPNGTPGSNGSNYKNAEFDSLYAKASVMLPSPERTALYDQLNKMAAEEMPLIWGVHRMSTVVQHSWLKNYKFSPFPYGMEQYLNVDLEVKNEIFKKL